LRRFEPSGIVNVILPNQTSLPFLSLRLIGMQPPDRLSYEFFIEHSALLRDPHAAEFARIHYQLVFRESKHFRGLSGSQRLA
jgi:hypothetical protein